MKLWKLFYKNDLHMACQYGEPVDVQKVLEASPFSLNNINKKGKTPLTIVKELPPSDNRELIYQFLRHVTTPRHPGILRVINSK